MYHQLYFEHPFCPVFMHTFCHKVFETRHGVSMADRKRDPIPDTVSEKARYPWNFLRLIGMRTIRQSADEREDREGVYNGRRSAKYGGAEHSSFLPVLLSVLGCRLTY